MPRYHPPFSNKYFSNVPVFNEHLEKHIDGQVFSYFKLIFYKQAFELYKGEYGSEQRNRVFCSFSKLRRLVAFHFVFPVAIEKLTVDDVKPYVCVKEAGVWLLLVGEVSRLNTYFIRRFQEEHQKMVACLEKRSTQQRFLRRAHFATLKSTWGW